MPGPPTTVCEAWCDPAEVAEAAGYTPADDDPTAVRYEAHVLVYGLDGMGDPNPGDPKVAVACAAASDVLYRMSGRRWPGACEAVVRPCATDAAGVYVHEGSPTAVWSGWLPLGVGACSGGLCCALGRSEIDLGYGPIADVAEVLVDGAVVDPAGYRLDNYRLLVRLADGGQARTWPCSQRLDVPATEPGTWQVTFTHGTLPPPEGVAAATALAAELLRGATGGDCKLPAGATTVTREGVTYEIDPAALLNEEGRVGIFAVDLFLAAVPRRRPPRLVVPGGSGQARRPG